MVLGSPTRAYPQGEIVKKDIHPAYAETQVVCTCGSTFTTRSTAKNGIIHADVCSQCHPFYTGKQKILDTGGRQEGRQVATPHAGPATPVAWTGVCVQPALPHQPTHQPSDDR